MPTSPETMIFEWKKVVNPDVAAQAAVALHKEGVEVEGAIYALPSQDIGGKAACDSVRQILSRIPNIESYDPNGNSHIDEFVASVVGMAEDAIVGRYEIEHFVEDDFIGTGGQYTYCTRETLESADFTFDDKKGTATPPAPLPPAK